MTKFFDYNNTTLNQIIDDFNKKSEFLYCLDNVKIIKTTYYYEDLSCDIQLHLDKDIDDTKRQLLLSILLREYIDYEFNDIIESSWLLENNIISFWFGRLENLNINTYLSDLED